MYHSGCILNGIRSPSKFGKSSARYIFDLVLLLVQFFCIIYLLQGLGSFFCQDDISKLVNIWEFLWSFILAFFALFQMFDIIDVELTIGRSIQCPRRQLICFYFHIRMESVNNLWLFINSSIIYLFNNM